MATFDPTIPSNSTQAPSYLNNSQGTDKAVLQPLADIPRLSEKYVQPDYKANTSGGTGLRGLGELGDSAVKLTDQVIQQNVDDTLHEGIDKIRDSFGVAQAADQSTGIADAVGKGGADGVSLADNDPNANTPVAVNRLGNRIQGLTEAYNQGGLSNSAYYAKLEAYTREVKAQFPGYSDIIDSKVSGIVGTTPANALRSSLLQDVTNLQNKVSAANDKWTSYEQKNAAYIYQQWPNYDQMKAQGNAPSRVAVETVIGRLQARDQATSASTAALGLETAQNAAVNNKAETIVSTKASDIAANLSVSVTNSMGLHTPDQFRQLLDDVNSGKRKPLTPDEKSQVQAAYAQLKQQYGIQFDKFINAPTSPSSGRTVASYLTPQRIGELRTQGMAALNDIQDGLTNEKYGLVTAAAIHSKAVNESADDSLTRRDPNAALVGAIRRQYGDNAITQMYVSTSPLASSTLEGLRQIGWRDISDPNSSAFSYLDKVKSESGNNGDLAKAHLSDASSLIIHPERSDDPDAAKAAVQHLFGPKNNIMIDAFQDKAAVPVFNALISPTMTKAISKMDKGSQDTYVTQAENWFTSIFNTQADNANQTAANLKTNGNITLTYDPDAVSFKFTRTGSRMSNLASGLAGDALVSHANQSLAPMNSAMKSMLEVFKVQHRDPTAELYRLLPVMGMTPGTPMYKAIQEEYIKKNPPKEEGSPT